MTRDIATGPLVLAGAALGQLFGAVAWLRRTKPLHPQGTVHPAELVRTGVAAKPWGVPWLDEPGIDAGVVRLSRSVGLPGGWPDILGLALRFGGSAGSSAGDDCAGVHDLLLASTSTAVGLRHALLPRWDPFATSYSSSFTYGTPRGPVVLAAEPLGGRRFAMKAASPLGAWQQFGVLTIGSEIGDPPLDLDAVRNSLPGLEMSPRLAALREPSYARARAHRPDS